MSNIERSQQSGQRLTVYTGNHVSYLGISDIVELVSNFVSIPIIVGGGISSPEIAARIVKAGASIVVTGTATEKNSSCMSEFASAVHWKG